MLKKIDSRENLEELFSNAIKERNRLTHNFYRQHNFRRNTDEGRKLMIQDLESIHDTLLESYKAALFVSGIDIDALIKKSNYTATKRYQDTEISESAFFDPCEHNKLCLRVLAS